ncbi:MAG: hypothetical protein ABFS10_04630 [Bacteroidota bacterium]
MKQIYILILGIMLILPLRAQDAAYRMDRDAPAVIARFSLITPKLVVEFAPVDHFTFTTGLWINPSFWRPNQFGDNEFHPRPTLNPRITMEPRYFINLETRTRNGNRTDYYSGWYVGLPFAMEFPDQKYSMGLLMGFQCAFGENWYWNVGIGPGCSYKEASFRMRPVFDVGFGWILN